MDYQEKLSQLNAGLDQAELDNGLKLSTELVEGEVDVLMVTVEDREEFPIYITVDESQILCITHLWTEAEVVADKRCELLEAMLSLNVPMPLSSFSKVGNQYIIFDALRLDSRLDDILESVGTLSDNTLTAIEELSEYLKK
jgi:hypothetical protein